LGFPGRKVMQSAVKNLTPIILELGGKDPFIVLEDAELDFAVQLACRGSFINLGQNCVSAERTFVHRKIYYQFAEKVVACMKGYVQFIVAVCFQLGMLTTSLIDDTDGDVELIVVP
jgi:acyl-CoA reductase-like NAD-dependent aldehyde dehydrogenase